MPAPCSLTSLGLWPTAIAVLVLSCDMNPVHRVASASSASVRRRVLRSETCGTDISEAQLSPPRGTGPLLSPLHEVVPVPPRSVDQTAACHCW